MKTYGVWCEVSGGVTGYRAAWLKDSFGIKRYETREEAEAEAHRLRAKPNRGPASFSYTVKPCGEKQ
jgi:hypothetical protein